MDYRKIFEEMGLEVAALPDNYTPDTFALNLLADIVRKENVIYSTSILVNEMNMVSCPGDAQIR